jgi:hypothetical protein
VTARKADIAVRVDALAHEHEGKDFVAAVRRLAGELGPYEQGLLQVVLLERAAEEEDFRKAADRRFKEKGWLRRSFAKLERARSTGASVALAVALEAGADGEGVAALLAEGLRRNPGQAVLVLDELSRHGNPQVRAWVPGAAAELLGASGVSVRLVLSMTRDADPGVRDAAIAAAVELDPEKARAIVPDQRRRLHAQEPAERAAAGWALAELGDHESLRLLRERGETAADPAERAAAQAAGLVLAGDESSIAAGLRAGDPALAPAFATAARLLGTGLTLGALADCAESGPDEACREACRAELARVREEA